MRTLIISLLSIVLLSGCMHNNGDIGNYFGTWHVESISVDDESDLNYSGNIFFQFQSDVVRLVENRGNNDLTEFFGTWVDNGADIVLNFGYKVDTESDVYNIPSVTRLVKGENIINVTYSGSSKMKWSFTSDGHNITYTLNKQ